MCYSYGTDNKTRLSLMRDYYMYIISHFCHFYSLESTRQLNNIEGHSLCAVQEGLWNMAVKHLWCIESLKPVFLCIFFI